MEARLRARGGERRQARGVERRTEAKAEPRGLGGVLQLDLSIYHSDRESQDT